MGEAELCRFEAVCVAFFMDGDAEGREVLEYFERTVASLEVGSVIIGEEPVVCRSCGVTALRLASAAQREQFRATKDRARSRAHAELLTRRRGRLARKLDEVVETNGPPTSWANLQRAMQGLRDFASKHAAELGAQAFFRGVLLLIVEQQRKPSVVRWRLDSAVLTDAHDEDFIDDAVRLFNELPLRRVRVGDALLLELDPTWSDVSLVRLLKSLGARRLATDGPTPTGTLEPSSNPRTNIDGTDDDTPPLADLLCLDFCSFL